MTESPDLIAAKAALKGSVGLALVKGGCAVSYCGRGIGDLYAAVKGGADYAGYAAADKIVGRAAAFLFVALKVASVYAAVLSEGGREVLLAYGIDCFYGELTENIINRAGSGRCPMEEATESVKDLAEAVDAIGAKLKELRAKAAR